MILVSKNIYLSRAIQCDIKILISRIHTSNVQFLPRRSKIGSIKTRDMIFVPNSFVSTRARECPQSLTINVHKARKGLPPHHLLKNDYFCFKFISFANV